MPDAPLATPAGQISTEGNPTEPEIAARALAADLERVSYGQRRVNLIWERTQVVIAISVVEVTLLVTAVLTISPVVKDTQADPAMATAAVTGLVLLSNLVGNVTGFYFSRTNHTKQGGIPPRDTPQEAQR